MREVTRRILERNGYHVAAAASGHDALQIVTGQLEHVDLLLTDVVMPRMQGREARRQDPHPAARRHG